MEQMNSQIVWMIIGMGLATYIPRMIPLVILQKLQLPVFLQNVLQNVPYAILGALIFPGVFFIHENIWFGVVGATIAFTFASFFSNVIVVVIGSILALSAVSFYF